MRKVVLAVSLVGLVGLAIGQGPADAQVPSPKAPVSAAPAVGADLVGQSSMYLVQIEAIRGRVQADLAQARQERDVVKTLCLNDKLDQIDVAQRGAVEREHALELAAKSGDKDGASHEFTVLSSFYRRVQELESEAQQCTGKETAYVGDSKVSLEMKTELPPEDVSDDEPPMPPVMPPWCRSCNR